MKWTCPRCGIRLAPGWIYPVYCECGHIDRGNGDVQYSQSRGLGDTLAKITRKLRIRPCGGCKKRQKKLNELFPYKESP